MVLQVFSMSNAAWQDMSGSKRSQLRREKWLDDDRIDPNDLNTSLGSVLGAMPSAKVSTMFAMQVHVVSMLWYVCIILENITT